MESALGLIIIIIAGIAWSRYQRAARHERMQRIADDLGGTFIGKLSGWGGDDSYADLDIQGRRVRLLTMLDDEFGTSGQMMCVTTPVDIGWSLSLRPTLPIVQMTRKTLTGASGDTRDKAFDEAYTLKSSRFELARVLFGSREDLRATPLRLDRVYVDVEHGKLKIRIFDHRKKTDAPERAMLDYVILLAEALETSGHLLDHEGASGGLSLATPTDTEGALSPTEAPEGALSPSEG